MNLICYLSNGYPTIESSKKIAQEYVEAGCDIIEIDFPSHNPFLESELIAGRMKKALENCSDYSAYMKGMVEIKEALPQTKFILMVYENTVEEIGTEKFIKFCLQYHYEDIILVGLKDDTIKNELIKNNLKVSCYVQFHLPEDEVEYAKNANGFVYLQAKPTTGKINENYPTLKDCITYLKAQGIDRKIYCGVGVHAPEDMTMVKEAGGDGAFVGSTILKLHDEPEKMKETIRKFKEKC